MCRPFLDDAPRCIGLTSALFARLGAVLTPIDPQCLPLCTPNRPGPPLRSRLAASYDERTTGPEANDRTAAKKRIVIVNQVRSAAAAAGDRDATRPPGPPPPQEEGAAGSQHRPSQEVSS